MRDRTSPAAMSPTRVTFDPDRVLGWADLTCDTNPLHLDRDFAAATPFGVPITHGHLLACVAVDTVQRGADEQLLEGGRVSVRFRAPVPVGDELRLDIRELSDGLALEGFCNDVMALQVQVDLPALRPQEDSDDE